MNAVSSFVTYVEELLSDGAKDVYADRAWEAFEVACWISLLTLGLELCCLETVKGVWKQPQGKNDLYPKAWIYTLCNNFLVGVPIYTLGTVLLCTHEIPSLSTVLAQTAALLTLHSWGFYYLHKFFHEHPWWYQKVHKFHHRFNYHTPPSSANCVTVYEFLLAYILPILPLPLFTIITNQERLIAAVSIKMSLTILGILNVLVHFPPLEEASQKWFLGFGCLLTII